MSIIARIRSLFRTRPTLEITFTPETSEQRSKVLKQPWWKEPHADEAKQLIHDEAVRRGETPPEPMSGYGSGWWIEFPRAVAMIIADEGIEKAAEYVRWTFDQGTTRDASKRIEEAFPDENPCVAYYG